MTFNPADLFLAQETSPGAALTVVDAKKADVAFLSLNPDAIENVTVFRASAEQFVAHIDNDDPWCLSAVAKKLPTGEYQLETKGLNPAQIASWALGQYGFKAYVGSDVPSVEMRKLVVADDAQRTRAIAIATSTWLARDLINQPANLLGPEELTQAAVDLAEQHDASVRVYREEEVAKGFPATHAVGRSSTESRQPHVIDMLWGDRGPTITLVGKGVCYDTGGLNLKPGTFMRNMKKDMGGAAHVLGLAKLIMMLGLPIRLRVIVGAVENSVASDSFRPGDVIKTRKGLTVEIGNTDAEGRLVLADCLTLAQEGERPDLLVNFATLTGAARVALGTDMPAVFSNHQNVADALVKSGTEVDDPMWSLPLYRPYAKRLNSPVADLGNIAEGERYGDAIIAALFLDHFVDAETQWLHIDCFAWNNSNKPGRPKGGATQGMMAVLGLIEDRLTRAV